MFLAVVWSMVLLNGHNLPTRGILPCAMFFHLTLIQSISLCQTSDVIFDNEFEEVNWSGNCWIGMLTTSEKRCISQTGYTRAESVKESTIL